MPTEDEHGSQQRRRRRSTLRICRSRADGLGQMSRQQVCTPSIIEARAAWSEQMSDGGVQKRHRNTTAEKFFRWTSGANLVRDERCVDVTRTRQVFTPLCDGWPDKASRAGHIWDKVGPLSDLLGRMLHCVQLPCMVRPAAAARCQASCSSRWAEETGRQAEHGKSCPRGRLPGSLALCCRSSPFGQHSVFHERVRMS